MRVSAAWPQTTARPLTQRRRGATVDDLVGNTPLVAFPTLTAHLPRQIQVVAKAEWTNPGGSVKDRPALNIIKQAERRGEMHPGVTLIDSTSGNTGIAYAMVCAARGYDITLVLPENASPERKQILRAYGVDLVLTDPLEGSDGSIRVVREMVAENPEKYFYADQYSNPDNWRAHYYGTGIEIWQQTQGQVTHFIAGLGTSGTMMGTGRRLRSYNSAIKLIAVQPDSPFHGLEGLKHMETAIRPAIYNDDLLDGIEPVMTEDAHEMCRRLAREEGLLVGVSAGAALVAALRTAENMADRGEVGTVVTLFPDNAAKYLSDPFWTAG
ncbi:MAG: PLP-dependent cysteine synthase family protein [Chloroflexi bacterium]|nr:PLP-dependent cysteine synthase family protein [Chloroflexota bacterium]